MLKIGLYSTGSVRNSKKAKNDRVLPDPAMAVSDETPRSPKSLVFTGFQDLYNPAGRPVRQTFYSIDRESGLFWNPHILGNSAAIRSNFAIL